MGGFAGIFFCRGLADRNPPAITLEGGTVQSGPGDHFLLLGNFKAGVKLRLTGTSALAQDGKRWLQVRYSRDAIGWAQEAILLLL